MHGLKLSPILGFVFYICAYKSVYLRIFMRDVRTLKNQTSKHDESSFEIPNLRWCVFYFWLLDTSSTLIENRHNFTPLRNSSKNILRQSYVNLTSVRLFVNSLTSVKTYINNFPLNVAC